MKCTIFGKNISFNFSNEKIRKILEKELSLYKTFNGGAVDVEVSFVEHISYESPSFISPSIHTTFNNGFLADYGVCKVLYVVQGNGLNISIELTRKSKFLKILSYDYRSNFDVVGTILHELVLVPMTYFFDNLAIVHSSAFKNNDTGEVFMAGGTGGVGKTSLELLFCKKENYSFISDDIAVVDAAGFIYPNLSYPKIYGYNTVSDKGFEKLILSDDILVEKAHWFLMKKLRGVEKIRRRVCPVKLYSDVENEKLTISKYFILLKSDNNNEIKKEKIVSKDVVKLTLDIIKNEYHAFHQHIVWHEYNCLANGLAPVLSINKIYADKGEIIDLCFKNTDSYYVRIPKNMKHGVFMKKIMEVVS